MGMQSHEWVSVQQVNERIKDFHRQADAERLANVARANQPEAERISLKRVAQYILSPLKRSVLQSEPMPPAEQRKVLVRNHRRAI